MVKNVKRKLNSSSGASIIISLMFFLVVMMVGAVCLVAAYNNSGRATRARKDVQHNYAVQSAIALIQEDLAKDKAKFIFYPEKSDSGDLAGYRVEIAKTNQVETEGVVRPKYGKLVYDLIASTFAEGKPDIYNPAVVQGIPGELSLTVPEEYEGLNVKGNFTLGSFVCPNAAPDVEEMSFDVIVGIWCEDDEGLKTYATEITFPASVRNISVYNADETVTRKVEVTWGEPQLGKQEAA